MKKKPHPTRFGSLAVGAAGLPRHSNHGRLQDDTRHLMVLKYQCRGCSQTRASTQQKRVPRKQTRPTRFGSAAVGAARLRRRPNYGRPPDLTRHLTFLKLQRRGFTLTSTRTQQTWEL